MTTLDEIFRQVESGRLQAAKRRLMDYLRANPHNVAAWMLLAKLLDDPQQQADCYQQVLGLDPGHRQAARALEGLTSPAEGLLLRCPQCGGAMETYFVEDLHDKRARCLYCGTEVDLPDSFQRVRRTRTSEQQAGVHRFEDTLVVESRSDGETPSFTPEEIIRLIQARHRETSGAQEFPEQLPYEHTYTSDEIRRLLDQQGLSVPDERLDELLDRYLFSEREEGGSARHVVVRRVETRRNLGDVFSQEGAEERQGCLSLLLRLLGESRVIVERSRPAPPAEMDVATIIKAAGGPLPPDERQSCPHCGATIFRQATRCPWCDAWLEKTDEGEL
ncbi:MAG: hypothetical protein ACP5GX_09205 [Anaerolineae bacterium]